MPGLITLLDDHHADNVRAIQETMAVEFGVTRGYPGDVPHFTYHLASGYDIGAASEVTRRIARATHPFSVATSGFGVFTGAELTLYIPVARSGQLAALHRRICDEMEAAGQPNDRYYHPDRALPHITITQQNVPRDALPAVLTWLAGQDFSWDVPVTNLALAEPTADGAHIFGRWNFP
ncbi:MAG: 2'-5' RNA ligase family protein [Tepidiformaceae bacterium]